MTTLPIEPELFWTLLGAGALLYACLLVFIALPEEYRPTASIERFQARLNLEQISPGLFLIGLLLWSLIFGLLFAGLLQLIWNLFWSALPNHKPALSDWRFTLALLTANTAVLAAVVAFPVTLIRLGLTRKQTDTAQEALFNDKVNAASEDLYAMRQRWDKKRKQNIWEDDIVRRSAAILRLEDLTRERPAIAPRIARILCLYVKELSKAFPAEVTPEFSKARDITEWSYRLTVKRPDMEGAVQTLGRLKDIVEVDPQEVDIDLSGCNLQKYELSNLNFNNAIFSGASLQGARFVQSRLQNADLSFSDATGTLFDGSKVQCAHLNRTILLSADFSKAKLCGSYFEGAIFDIATYFFGADFRGAAMQTDCSELVLSQSQIDGLFYDASTKLPVGLKRKEGWDRELILDQFTLPWRAWQKSIGFDPEDPSTWEAPSH